MGTSAESTVITTSGARGRALNQNIAEIIAEVEGRISRTDSESEIYRLNELLRFSPLNYYNITPETARFLRIAQDVQTATNGAFSPILGEIIDLWGIKDRDREHELPQRAQFFPALERSKSSYEIQDNYFTTESYGYQFDLSGISRGYALDHVNSYLESQNIRNAFIRLGKAQYSNSIVALGKSGGGDLWRIGTPGGIIQASDKFISIASGNEHRATIRGVDYIHIIDPSTGYPVAKDFHDLRHVIVIMDAPSASMPRERRERFRNNGVIADALSTALFVMGRQGALEFYKSGVFDFEMILFVRSESDPRGYEILRTNVIFDEF